MYSKLKELLDDHQTGMSEFQDDYFVTARAGGTEYGQYKQSLRELYKRFRGLRELIYGPDGQKILELKIRKLEKKIEDGKLNDIDREMVEIKLYHKSIVMEEADRAIYDTKREFTRFYQQAHALKEKIGELTPEKRRELDQGMWIYRVKEMAAIDYMQTGRLKNTTIEFMSCLPKNERQKVYELVFGDKDKLIDDYINREEVYSLPFDEMKLEEIDFDNVEKLIAIEMRDITKGNN